MDEKEIKTTQHFDKRDMDKYEKKITYSKAQVFATGCIFCISIAFVVYMYCSNRISDGYDTAALVTLISVSGAIFGSNLCWYSKKAASENHYKLRMSLFHDSARVRLHYNEEMIKMMKKYGITELDMEKINDSGDMDEFMNNAITNVVSDLDTTQNDSDSTNTLDSFNI